MKDKILGALKNLVIWGLLPLAFLTFLFVLGEQFEVGRLSVMASCKDCPDVSLCAKEKGYLASEPYYPDLTRRYLGAYARAIGGDLGASYQVTSGKPAALDKPKTDKNDDQELLDEVKDKKI
jgi:hypothetical protein